MQTENCPTELLLFKFNVPNPRKSVRNVPVHVALIFYQSLSVSLHKCRHNRRKAKPCSGFQKEMHAVKSFSLEKKA